MQEVAVGVHEAMTDAAYQSLPYLRASDMPAAALSMAHLRAYQLAARPEVEPDALLFGRLVHAIMADDLGGFVVADGPINKRTGKPYGRDTDTYALWVSDLEESGMAPVPTSWLHRAWSMVDAIRASADAEPWMEGAKHEVSFVAEICGVRCKARVDLFGGNKWADIKTMRGPAIGFPREAKSHSYVLKAAFQCLVIEAACKGRPTEHAWIAVEKEPPHGVIVYTMPIAKLLAWSDEVMRIIRAVSEASISGHWPSYSIGTRELDVKPWDVPGYDEDVIL